MIIDWNKAPQGAQWARETTDGAVWYKREGAAWLYFTKRGFWKVAYGTNESICEPRPQWQGEGSPPVETVCEWKHSASDAWHKAKVNYIGCTYVIFATRDDEDEQHYYLRDISFRPIRTPEQIAAEQRSAELNQMIGSIKDHPHKYPGVTHLSQLKIQEDACIDLYDAGWRKVTP